MEDQLYGGTVATAPEPESVLLPWHDVPLGRYTTVRRLLPQRQRRMVGAWCFVDHFGPEDVSGRPGMQVPPHPHTGLQTVTWLVDGEIVHRDSLGSDQPIRPGQLNLMSSGHGISHSEMSPPEHPPGMHGLQLWVALPEEERHGEARFEHHADLPVLRDGDATLTVLAGRYKLREVAGRRPHTAGGGRDGAPGAGLAPAAPGADVRVRRPDDVRRRGRRRRHRDVGIAAVSGTGPVGADGRGAGGGPGGPARR